MRDEFMIERNGKKFVLFAGLLDEVHTRWPHTDGYVKSMTTLLVQAPRDDNGQVAIVHASFKVMDQDGDLIEGPYQGIGDASPQNVGRNIKPHLIRMAETRAKARAYRDAINVDAAALEELGGEDEDQPKQPRQRSAPQQEYRSESGATATRGGAAQQTDPDQPALNSSKGRLRYRINKSGDWGDVEEWEEAHQLIDTMTEGQVQKAIYALENFSE